MLKILSSFVIPFLLAGSLNNISPKRQNEETGLNYKSIIAEKDFSFEDDVINDSIRKMHYDQLFDFKNFKSIDSDIINNFFSKYSDGEDNGHKYFSYLNKKLFVQFIETKPNMDFGENIQDYTFAIDNDVLKQLEYFDFINAKLPSDVSFTIPYLMFDDQTIIGIKFDGSKLHVSLEDNGFKISIVKNNNGDSFFRIPLQIKNRLEKINVLQCQLSDSFTFNYSIPLYKYWDFDGQFYLARMTNYTPFEITSFEYNAGNPKILFDVYNSNSEFNISQLKFDYSVDNNLYEGYFYLSGNLTTTKVDGSSYLSGWFTTSEFQPQSGVDVDGQISSTNMTCTYTLADARNSTQFNFESVKFQYRTFDAYSIFYVKGSTYFRYQTWLNYAGGMPEQYYGFNCYFDENKKHKIQNIYEFHFKGQYVNNKNFAFSFYFNENEKNRAQYLDYDRRIWCADYEYTYNLKNDMGQMYGTTIDDQGNIFDNYIRNTKGYGNHEFKTIEPLEICYKTKTGEYCRGTTNKDGLFVNQETGVVFDIDGNIHDDLTIYEDESGFKYPSTDGTKNGIVTADNVTNQYGTPDNFSWDDISNFYEDLSSDVINNIKNALNNNKLWQLFKTTFIVIVSALGLLVLFNIGKFFYKLIKKLFK